MSYWLMTLKMYTMHYNNTHSSNTSWKSGTSSGPSGITTGKQTSATSADNCGIKRPEYKQPHTTSFSLRVFIGCHSHSVINHVTPHNNTQNKNSSKLAVIIVTFTIPSGIHWFENPLIYIHFHDRSLSVALFIALK